MIRFYCVHDDSASATIQDVLDELCIAHATIELESAADIPRDLAEQGDPPILVDGRDVITDPRRITTHLEGLERFKKQWYKFQSDACYCDDEGQVQ